MKTRSLYKGKIQVEFNENNHAYLVNGERCKISVTGATGMMDKPNLKFWSVKMMKQYLLAFFDRMENKYSHESLLEAVEEGSKVHIKFKDQAASIGTQVHDWAEQYILWKLKRIKTKPEIDKNADEKVNNGILAFLQWVNGHKIKFIDSELLIYSKKYGYCGLVDCIAEVDGQMTLVDFKTSNFMSLEYYAQVAAYAFADSEESKRKYDRALIIKFSKETGDFELKERSKKEMKEDYQAFLGLLEVKKWSDKYSVPFKK